MNRSDTLRFRDVRDAYRLIGDCRDVGHDPALWHRTMLDRLARRFGVVEATGGEGWWTRPGGRPRPVSAHDVSADSAAHSAFLAYHRAVGPADDPIFRAIQRSPARVVTRSRSHLVPDAVWYRSAAFTDYRRVGGVDHALTSVCQTSDRGATSVISLNRALHDRDFSPREQQWLTFFHAELGRLVGGSLRSETEPRLDELPPRLRQTLACLLEGDAEKQVAGRLGLSPATVHEYVTALYRRLGVRSRAQLLAHAIRRGWE